MVPLPLIVAGISLYNLDQGLKQSGGSTTRSSSPHATTAFILVVHFITWPLISVGIIYATVKHANILVSDPMLWFATNFMPTGPHALTFITMVQVSDAGVEDERKITEILTVSYTISPILAVVTVGVLYVSVVS